MDADRDVAPSRARTALAELDAFAGTLAYRGYDVATAIAGGSFEEIAYLLLFGALPTRTQLADLVVRLAANRALPPPALAVLTAAPKDAAPTDVLRTAVSALAFSAQRLEDGAHPLTPRAAIGLVAKVPTIVANWDRLRRGLAPIAPLPNLGTAANLLYMRTGRAPEPAAERALDVYLMALAEHGIGPSTTAALAASGDGADLYGATCAALATLPAATHGGAAARVLAHLRALGPASGGARAAADDLAAGAPLPGFDHPFYRTRDPRAAPIEAVTRELVGEGVGKTYAVARALEDAATERHATVDLYAAALLDALGFAADAFACVFACARIAGWTAHVLEDLGRARGPRPGSTYVGEGARPWIPLDRRGGQPEGAITR